MGMDQIPKLPFSICKLSNSQRSAPRKPVKGKPLGLQKANRPLCKPNPKQREGEGSAHCQTDKAPVPFCGSVQGFRQGLQKNKTNIFKKYFQKKTIFLKCLLLYQKHLFYSGTEYLPMHKFPQSTLDHVLLLVTLKRQNIFLSCSAEGFITNRYITMEFSS